MSIPIISDSWPEFIQGPTRRRYVGLDLSLTATGIAVIEEDGTYTTRVLPSKGTKGATLRDRGVRLHNLAADIVIAACTADIVCIEGPSYGQTTGSHHDRSGLWWLVVDALMGEDLDLIEITPAQVKKYATGKGNAGKDAVLASVIRRYDAAPVETNDEADAFVLAAIAARLDGHPIETSLPQTHLDALKAVKR